MKNYPNKKTYYSYLKQHILPSLAEINPLDIEELACFGKGRIGINLSPDKVYALYLVYNGQSKLMHCIYHMPLANEEDLQLQLPVHRKQLNADTIQFMQENYQKYQREASEFD